MHFIQKYPTPTAFMVASSSAWCSSNHTGPRTIRSVLPPNCTSLPDTGNPGKWLKWQLHCLHKSDAHISVCCCAAGRNKLLGIHDLHKLSGVCVWATSALQGTLADRRYLYISVYKLWLVRYFFYRFFFFFLA